jgi:hypothetical protein
MHPFGMRGRFCRCTLPEISVRVPPPIQTDPLRCDRIFRLLPDGL